MNGSSRGRVLLGGGETGAAINVNEAGITCRMPCLEKNAQSRIRDARHEMFLRDIPFTGDRAVIHGKVPVRDALLHYQRRHATPGESVCCHHSVCHQLILGVTAVRHRGGLQFAVNQQFKKTGLAVTAGSLA